MTPYLLLPHRSPMRSSWPRSFFECHAPFRPASREPCTTVRPKTYLCGSHGDATRCCEHFTGPFPGHDPELARGYHAGHENLLESVYWWRSTSANHGSRCSVREHGPQLTRQLSPSDDREASRAQRKAGSKRADGGVRQNSRSSERSSADRHRARIRHSQVFSDSSPDQTPVSRPDPIYTLPPPPPPPRAFAEFFEWPVQYRPASRDELGSICWWSSTSANRGSCCSVQEHGPQPAAAAESPTEDREASRAQRKAGSKRADGGVRQSSERSSTDWHRARVRHRQVSSDSPTRRLSPPAKHSRFGSRHVPSGSSSSEGSARSPPTRLLRRSRSPVPRRRGPSPQVQR